MVLVEDVTWPAHTFLGSVRVADCTSKALVVFQTVLPVLAGSGEGLTINAVHHGPAVGTHVLVGLLPTQGVKFWHMHLSEARLTPVTSLQSHIHILLTKGSSIQKSFMWYTGMATCITYGAFILILVFSSPSVFFLGLTIRNTRALPTYQRM